MLHFASIVTFCGVTTLQHHSFLRSLPFTHQLFLIVLELDSTVLEELCKMHHLNLAKSNKYLQHQSQDLAQYFFVHWWWCWQYPGYCAKVGHWSAYHSESLQSAVNTWINCHETRINHKRFAFRIRNPENSAQGIRNPAYDLNPESSTRSPESTAQNPESIPCHLQASRVQTNSLFMRS